MRIEVVVEVPKGSRSKYECNHEAGAIWLDRELFTATRYPADYGFVPETLAEDGDPLDALVVVNEACRVPKMRPAWGQPWTTTKWHVETGVGSPAPWWSEAPKLGCRATCPVTPNSVSSE